MKYLLTRVKVNTRIYHKHIHTPTSTSTHPHTFTYTHIQHTLTHMNNFFKILIILLKQGAVIFNRI